MIAKKYGAKGLPEHTLNVKFKGSAGQSFGAFLVPGVNFKLEGEANDYLGKGLSGGRISQDLLSMGGRKLYWKLFYQ